MEGNLIELLTLQNYGNRTRPILVLLSKEFFFFNLRSKKIPIHSFQYPIFFNPSLETNFSGIVLSFPYIRSL